MLHLVLGKTEETTIGGLGILLCPYAMKSFDPRILVASFKGNPMTSVICCYTPTNTSDENVL